MVRIATRDSVAGPTRLDPRGVSNTLPAHSPTSRAKGQLTPSTLGGKGHAKGVSPRVVASPPPLSKDYLNNQAKTLESASKSLATKKPTPTSSTHTSTTSDQNITLPPKLSTSNLSLLEKPSKQGSKTTVIIQKNILSKPTTSELISDTSSSSDGSLSVNAPTDFNSYIVYHSVSTRLHPTNHKQRPKHQLNPGIHLRSLCQSTNGKLPLPLL